MVVTGRRCSGLCLIEGARQIRNRIGNVADTRHETTMVNQKLLSLQTGGGKSG